MKILKSALTAAGTMVAMLLLVAFWIVMLPVIVLSGTVLQISKQPPRDP